MRANIDQIKELLPNLPWSPEELAEKLSLAGHETEITSPGQLNITLTANRRDCQDLAHLVFDLAGVYGLKTKPDLIKFGYTKTIDVTAQQINHLLGSQITLNDLKRLENLGFKVSQDSVTPPDFRDVATVADVAEEVVRQIGYDQLGIVPLSKQSAPSSTNYQQLLAIKSALIEVGLTETSTSSFTSDGVIGVRNPFSQDEPFLRPNLLTGLLRTLARNPFLKRAAFFEVGEVFTPKEVTKLGLIVAGYRDPNVWQAIISQALGQPVVLSDIKPSQANQFEVKQSRLNWLELPVEKIRPVTTERQISLDRPLPQFKTISKSPPLTLDFNIANSNSGVEEIISQARDKFSDTLLFIEVIDRYGDSVTLRFVFQKMTGSFTQEEIKRLSGETADFLKPFGKDKI